MQEAGLSKAQLEKAIEESRGAGGATVDSATADAQFDALKKYGMDLTEKAAELDPVIGRCGLWGCRHAPFHAQLHAVCEQITAGHTRPVGL